jgi:RimJ/RimL family protein N-acetyltransferase
MNIVPFQASHLYDLSLQESQLGFSNYFDEKYGAALRRGGPCFSGFDGDQMIGCAGIIHQWDNRAIAWALLSQDCGKCFVKIHKAVRNFLDMADYNRIEAYVDADFEQGHRWVEMLKFEQEGLMRQFNPDGRDAYMYARLK